MTVKSRQRRLLPLLVGLSALVVLMPVTATAAPAAVGRGPAGGPYANSILLGVYPGGITGEMYSPTWLTPAEVIIPAIKTLQGTRDDFSVHLYMSWKDVSMPTFWQFHDEQIRRYATAGFQVMLSIRYAPPEGRDGDVAGYTAFVREVVQRYRANTAVVRYVVGNEADVRTNRQASDGAYRNVIPAIANGVLTARYELNRVASPAQVGLNFAVNGRDDDAKFLEDLVRAGGEPLLSSVGFVGIDVYPGLWPPTDDDPYHAMWHYLAESRAAMGYAGFPATVTLDVLENGYPHLDEAEQAARLEQMFRAVLDHGEENGVCSYTWFDLWDVDTGSDNLFAHFGLLRSDMTPKPAFFRYRDLIAQATRP